MFGGSRISPQRRYSAQQASIVVVSPACAINDVPDITPKFGRAPQAEPSCDQIPLGGFALRFAKAAFCDPVHNVLFGATRMVSRKR